MHSPNHKLTNQLETDIQPDRQTNSQPYRHTDIQTVRHIRDRQTDRQTVTQRVRQTHRQTHRHRQTDSLTISPLWYMVPNLVTGISSYCWKPCSLCLPLTNTIHTTPINKPNTTPPTTPPTATPMIMADADPSVLCGVWLDVLYL